MADKIISSTLSKGTSSQVKSVWGVPLQSQDQAPSLSDVMSEQMATDLQEKEDKSELKKIVAHIRETEGTVEASESFADNEADVADEQCTDDLLIAQMLQLQFDQVFQFCQVMGFTYDLRWLQKAFWAANFNRDNPYGSWINPAVNPGFAAVAAAAAAAANTSPNLPVPSTSG